MHGKQQKRNRVFVCTRQKPKRKILESIVVIEKVFFFVDNFLTNHYTPSICHGSTYLTTPRKPEKQWTETVMLVGPPTKPIGRRCIRFSSVYFASQWPFQTLCRLLE